MKDWWYKSKHFLAPIIKIGISLCCLGLIVYQWIKRPVSIQDLGQVLQEIPLYTIPLMIGLSMYSWMIESKKWQYVTRDVCSIRFRESVYQNLTAQAASYLTPLRIGELVTKASFFSSQHRKNIAARAVAGNLSQLSITLVMGIIGSLYFTQVTSIHWSLYVFTICGFVLIALVILWGFNKLKTLPLNRTQWLVTCGYSGFRYIVFATNWLIILTALDYPDSSIVIMQKIAVMYLLFSALPIIQLIDIPVRWTTAAMVFSGSLIPDHSILIATTMVWIINSIIPTVIGALLLSIHHRTT